MYFKKQEKQRTETKYQEITSVEEGDVTGKDYTFMHMNMYTLVGKNTMDVILSLEKY